MIKRVMMCIVAMLVTGIICQAKTKSMEPDNYAYLRGVEAYTEDNNQDALDWFDKEISEHPDNGYAYLYLSAIRSENGEYGNALSAINQAIKKLPKKDKGYTAVAYGTRAGIYLVMEDTISALKDYGTAIKLNPENTVHYEYRAGLYYALGQYEFSDADYRKMTDIDPGDVMGYMGIGRNAIANERWNDAISQFDYVIKLAPDYSNGYSFRAEAYIGQKNWNEATDDIVKALDIDGDNKAFYLMQVLPNDASDLLKSKFKIQMAKQPTESLWPYCLAVLYNCANDYDNAISYYEKANSLDANSVFLKYIAKCYVGKKDYVKALDYADRALAMNPEDYDVVDLKADILSQMGKFDDCLIERDKYVAKYPEYTIAYLSRADDLLSARKFESAIEDYNTAVVLAPTLSDYAYLLMRRGDAYRFVGKDAEARKDYEHLLTVEKDSVLTSDSWTPFAYSGLGNRDKAIETIQFILSNDTTEASGNLYNAACVYARLGLNDEALNYLKDAIAKGYDNITYMESDYDLDNLRVMPEYKQMIDSVSLTQPISIIDVNLEKEETANIEVVEVPFTKEGGVTKVKCAINDLPLHFVFDTGAADVTMSMVEANFMLKNNYITPDDIIGSARYIDANGDISEGTVINLRKVNFGGLELDNVRASVVRNQKAPLLLGQSVLGRLGKIEIDNPALKLIITHKVAK